jgi:phosphatidylserine/phosphatidylglycerophosphate/cardiolipin synthase-like enzyme
MNKAYMAAFLFCVKAAYAGQIEAAFSPEYGAESLVLKVINNAHSSIRLAGYSFTSAPVVSAMLAAKHRGVDVEVVVDEKENRGAKPHAALGALVAAGIPTRTISVYAINHDKYLVTDNANVETGSFNFTAAAAHRNSENVIVVWNDRELAAQYLKHWQSRFDQGRPVQ